jgi:hypothetical protein
MAKTLARKNLTTQRLARRARIYRGIQVTVARELGVTEGHVSLVARGLRSSQRVEKALAAAVLAIERKAA